MRRAWRRAHTYATATRTSKAAPAVPAATAATVVEEGDDAPEAGSNNDDDNDDDEVVVVVLVAVGTLVVAELVLTHGQSGTYAVQLEMVQHVGP